MVVDSYCHFRLLAPLHHFVPRVLEGTYEIWFYTKYYCLTIGLTLTECGVNQVNNVSTQPENLITVSFMVKGYTCEYCTKAVGSAVEKLDGIGKFDSKVTG